MFKKQNQEWWAAGIAGACTMVTMAIAIGQWQESASCFSRPADLFTMMLLWSCSLHMFAVVKG